MNYANIKYSDIANGSGVRTSVFVSGCTHHCPGCFNEEAWDFDYGSEFSERIQKKVLNSLESDYVSGLTLLGGEPMEPVNQRGLVSFLEQVKETLPDKTIWIYTGYTYHDELMEGGRAYTEVTDRILALTDVIVDGKFKQDEYDISLRFRGSSNQRIIDVPASRIKKEIVLWEDSINYARR